MVLALLAADLFDAGYELEAIAIASQIGTANTEGYVDAWSAEHTKHTISVDAEPQIVFN